LPPIFPLMTNVINIQATPGKKLTLRAMEQPDEGEGEDEDGK